MLAMLPLLVLLLAARFDVMLEPRVVVAVLVLAAGDAERSRSGSRRSL